MHRRVSLAILQSEGGKKSLSFADDIDVNGKTYISYEAIDLAIHSVGRKSVFKRARAWLPPGKGNHCTIDES